MAICPYCAGSSKGDGIIRAFGLDSPLPGMWADRLSTGGPCPECQGSGIVISGRIRNAKPEVRAAFDEASEMLAVAENSGIP